MSDVDTNKLLIIILCFILPPVAIWWQSKKVDNDVIINLILTILFWIPGVLHAIWWSFFR